MLFFFFFNDTATTEIYTLSLHDALPIFPVRGRGTRAGSSRTRRAQDSLTTLSWMRPPSGSIGSRRLPSRGLEAETVWTRSEEHTSELQSRQYLVCRLLLEKKKNKRKIIH